MAARGSMIESLKLADIFVVGQRRPLKPETVEALAASISEIGLQHPLTVRFVDHLDDPNEGELDGAYVLVAGRHRLEAARSLNLSHVDCVVVRWDDRQARKWEIAENLHRADLTELQRKEQIAEWIAITEEEQGARGAEVFSQVEKKPSGGRPEGGVNAARRDLGIDKNEAYRAVKIASIDEAAKQAAIAANLDNNQSALLKIARAAPAQQEAVVREIAAERAGRKVKANKDKSSGADEVTPGPPSVQRHHYHATADDHVRADSPEHWRALSGNTMIAVIIDRMDEVRIKLRGGYPSDYAIDNNKLYCAQLDEMKDCAAAKLIIVDVAVFLERNTCIVTDDHRSAA